MNSFILYIFLWILDNGSFTRVNLRNKTKLEAINAYRLGQYNIAASQYQLLTKQSLFTPPEVTINYAHALFEAKDTLGAKRIYTQLSQLTQPDLASTTYLQLGLIYCYAKDTAQALILLKQALVLKPSNDLARFNYELLKRKFHPSNKAPYPKSTLKQQANQNQQQTPQQQQAEIDNNAEKQLLKTLKNYGLTIEKAKIILDGMKNSEIQYIQQRQHSSKSKKSEIKQNW